MMKQSSEKLARDAHDARAIRQWEVGQIVTLAAAEGVAWGGCYYAWFFRVHAGKRLFFTWPLFRYCFFGHPACHSRPARHKQMYPRLRQCTSSSAGAPSGVSTFIAEGFGGVIAVVWNVPGSFPANATFMNSIQMGSAAWAPLSFAPSVFLLVVTDPHSASHCRREPHKPGIGEIVGRAGLPGERILHPDAAMAVPCCTTSCSIEVMMRAVRDEMTSLTSGKSSSSTRPS